MPLARPESNPREDRRHGSDHPKAQINDDEIAFAQTMMDRVGGTPK